MDTHSGRNGGERLSDSAVGVTAVLRALQLIPSVYDIGMTADNEPALATDPSLIDVLQELIRREPIFHRPELGTTRADFENMTASDFWEVGASGRRYGRKYVLETLEKRHAAPHTDVW